MSVAIFLRKHNKLVGIPWQKEDRMGWFDVLGVGFAIQFGYFLAAFSIV